MSTMATNPTKAMALKTQLRKMLANIEPTDLALDRGPTNHPTFNPTFRLNDTMHFNGQAKAVFIQFGLSKSDPGIKVFLKDTSSLHGGEQQEVDLPKNLHVLHQQLKDETKISIKAIKDLIPKILKGKGLEEAIRHTNAKPTSYKNGGKIYAFKIPQTADGRTMRIDCKVTTDKEGSPLNITLQSVWMKTINGKNRITTSPKMPIYVSRAVHRTKNRIDTRKAIRNTIKKLFPKNKRKQ